VPDIDAPVTIVGGGIIGLSCAHAIARRGRPVVVVDGGTARNGASFGHSAGIAVTWVSPQGLPGLLRRLPGWLLDPLGPVAVRWPHLHRLVPWLMRFERYRTPAQIRRIGGALASLMDLAWPAWEGLLDDIGASDLVRHDGSLTAYRTAGDLEGDWFPWAMRRDHGHEVIVVEGRELHGMEPALSREYGVAVHEPAAKWCEDPLAIIDGLHEGLAARDGAVHRGTVTSIVADSGRVRALRTSAGWLEVGDLVIAAGAWSHRLAGQLGHRVPLESERGYHADLPTPGVLPRRILALAPYKMVATPLRSGLRLAGTAEFGGLDAPPDYGRARALVTNGARALHGLDATGHSEWSGHRPILPDSLPVMGRSPNHENVFFAFGHSHIGFTLGPLTGELIAELVTGEAPSVDLDPFAIDRFPDRPWTRPDEPAQEYLRA
jgi:D-amino-acid dehydrogenase